MASGRRCYNSYSPIGCTQYIGLSGPWPNSYLFSESVSALAITAFSINWCSGDYAHDSVNPDDFVSPSPPTWEIFYCYFKAY